MMAIEAAASWACLRRVSILFDRWPDKGYMRIKISA